MRREMFTSRRENGGGLCLAFPIIQTVIFRPVKAKTISMPTSRNFFASRPLGIVELFADPIVRMRIGGLRGDE